MPKKKEIIDKKEINEKKEILKNKEIFGTILAFGTALLSGFAIFANKIFVVGIDPIVFTALRAIMIGAIFFLLSLYVNKWKFSGFKNVKWGYMIFIGVIGGGLAFWLFFSGLQLTTSGRAAFLHKTLPIYVTLLAFFFLKEKITKKQLWALLAMVGGLVILVSSQIPISDLWRNPQLGDALIIAATFLWGIENVIAKKAMIEGDTNWIVSFSRMFFGAVFLFGVMLLTSKFTLIFEVTAQQWFYLFVSTSILFGFILTYYWSIWYINVSKAASILLLAPVITLVLGMGFLDEPVTILQLVGSTIILIGAYFIATSKSGFVKI